MSMAITSYGGGVQVRFHDGEVLTWNKVTTTINNLILGKIYVDHAGTMCLCSNLHSNEMRVKFKDTGSMFGASKRTVSGSSFEGGKEQPGFRCRHQPPDMEHAALFLCFGAYLSYCRHSGNELLCRIEGVWCEYIKMDTGSGMETVWTAAGRPQDPTRYNLTQFAIQLNELTPGLKEKLPPTDCRLRPDQSALEQGYFDKVLLCTYIPVCISLIFSGRSATKLCGWSACSLPGHVGQQRF